MLLADATTGSSNYNNSVGDNAYVGYMYGTSGSTTYEATHLNTNNSAIKTYSENCPKICRRKSYTASWSRKLCLPHRIRGIQSSRKCLHKSVWCTTATGSAWRKHWCGTRF